MAGLDSSLSRPSASARPESLQHEYALHPITALAFDVGMTGNLSILAGEGSFLKVFDSRASKVLCRCEVFKGQAIHGITIQETSDAHAVYIAIWGGSSLVLLNRRAFGLIRDQHVSSITHLATSVSDWIFDVAISPFDPGTCVLLTANNKALQARLGLAENVTIMTLCSPSTSSLYCAHLSWESSSQILVAAGTVFGEIVVWRCSTTGNSESLCTLTGHEGSIFGVSISPLIRHSDKSTCRLLVSCSDDRTLRIWDISTSANKNQAATAKRAEASRAGGSEPRVNERCLATAMGHASRIWRVKFLMGIGHSATSRIDVLSFGEDCSAQQWALKLQSPAESSQQVEILQESASRQIKSLPYAQDTLTWVKTFAYHVGKHIWSAALHVDGDRTILATGGADGKISMYDVDVSKPLCPPSDSTVVSIAPTASTLCLDFKDVMSSLRFEAPEIPVAHYVEEAEAELPHEHTHPSDLSESTGNTGTKKKKKPKKKPKDALSRYAFISDDQFVATTIFGRVFLGCVDFSKPWQEVALPASGSSDLKSYSVVEGFPEIGIVVLTGFNGIIYGYPLGQTIIELGRIDAKVADMFKVRRLDSLDTDPATWHLLVTTIMTGKAFRFRFDMARLFNGDLSKDLRRSEGSFEYSLPEKFIVTSAYGFWNLLVLGSRSGFLAFYSAADIHPIHVWHPQDIPSADAITSIISLPGQAPDVGSGSNDHYFLTTSRNGTYSIFCSRISTKNSGIIYIRTSLIHVGTPPLGPNIESAWFSEQGDLLLHGFKSKDFVVWNETWQCEVTSVECGGAHRGFAYHTPPSSTNSSSGDFIFTKTSRLCLHSHHEPSHGIIRQGGHGREIKACAISPDGNIIATGAEDTSIRLWSYRNAATPSLDEDDMGLACKAIVHKHTAGIQQLRFSSSSQYLLSSGGSEEFYIWAITTDIPGWSKGIGVVCEAGLMEKSKDGDLRIMSFDISPLPCLEEEKLLISLAYSDSTIRIYTYSNLKGFALVAKGRYTSKCLTQIRHLYLSPQCKLLQFITAATDGGIVRWRVALLTENVSEGQLVQLSGKKIHQNAIKAFDIVTTENYAIIATGGDDNSLAISIYPNQYDSASTVNSQVFALTSAHAAAVTGLSLSAGREANTFVLVSSSNDQRVKEWRVMVSSPQGEKVEYMSGKQYDALISKTADVFTPISDVGDVALLRDGSTTQREANEKRFLVVGNGMEVWRLLEQDALKESRCD